MSIERIANMISSEEEAEELLRLLNRKGLLKKQKLLCLSQVREDIVGRIFADNLLLRSGRNSFS